MLVKNIPGIPVRFLTFWLDEWRDCSSASWRTREPFGGAPNQKTRSLPAAALRVLFPPLLMKASFQHSGKNKTRFLTETGFFGLGG